MMKIIKKKSLAKKSVPIRSKLKWIFLYFQQIMINSNNQ